jgi:ribosomal protein S18 acetylase RimI-like enzyme
MKKRRPVTGNVRMADRSELDRLARIWYDGWQDAHAGILPAELARIRTLESFRDRLTAALPYLRVAGPPGAPVGFCLARDDELYQLYVSAEARGSGVAAALMAEAESRLAAGGTRTAGLACAVGNDRAARFYEKCGWRRAGTVSHQPEAADGITFMVWRYEKRL